jgi:hypothetical protein
VKQMITLISLWLLMAGCSGLNVQTDYDPDAGLERLETFAFLTETDGDSLDEVRIVKAVTRNLEAKGYRFVEAERASFWIQTTTHIVHDVPSPFSFGFGFGSFGGGTGISVGASQRPRNDERHIQVEMLDPATRQVLWEGEASGRVGPGDTPESRQAAIDRLTDALFRDFPHYILNIYES